MQERREWEVASERDRLDDRVKWDQKSEELKMDYIDICSQFSAWESLEAFWLWHKAGNTFHIMTQDLCTYLCMWVCGFIELIQKFNETFLRLTMCDTFWIFLFCSILFYSIPFQMPLFLKCWLWSPKWVVEHTLSFSSKGSYNLTHSVLGVPLMRFDYLSSGYWMQRTPGGWSGEHCYDGISPGTWV